MAVHVFFNTSRSLENFTVGKERSSFSRRKGLVGKRRPQDGSNAEASLHFLHSITSKD